jgi:hypothetical protein
MLKVKAKVNALFYAGSVAGIASRSQQRPTEEGAPD